MERDILGKATADLAKAAKCMTCDIVIDALRMAWYKRHPSKDAGLIFHSDRGSQYASKDFRDVLTDYGITASMSR